MTEQVFQLRGCHLLSVSSIREETLLPDPRSRCTCTKVIHCKTLAWHLPAQRLKRGKKSKLGSKPHVGGFATSAHCLSLSLRACQSTLQLYIGLIIEGKKEFTAYKSQAPVQQDSSSRLLGCPALETGCLIPQKSC